MRPCFNEASPGTMAWNETDSNADTCCLGANFSLFNRTHRVADVYGYDGTSGKATNVPIASGATAYDCTHTNKTWILIIHEGLFYGSDLDHSLLNPNQIRAHGVKFWDNPYDPNHDLCIEISDELSIPLIMKGTKVYFESRVPTEDELLTCDQVELTSSNAWDPKEVVLASLEKEENPDPVRMIKSISLKGQTHHLEPSYLDPRMGDLPLCEVGSLLTNEGRIIKSVQYDPDTLDEPLRRTHVSSDRHSKVTAEGLAEKFGIGIYRARATMRATLQRGLRSAILPLARRYRSDRIFSQKRLMGRFSSDTLYFKVKSLHGYIASQVYFHKCGFVKVYHLSKTDDANVGPTLNEFIADYGVPEHLTMDGAAVQVGSNTKFMNTIRRNHIDYHVSHPRRPDQNPAEGGIRELKRKFYRIQQKYQVHPRLSDYLLEYCAELMCNTVNTSRYAKGRTPMEVITGITPDITEYLDFHFYQWVYFRTNAGLGPREIGRWIGISHRRGPMMTYWILPKSGIPISCDTVQRVTNEEKKLEITQQLMDNYNKEVDKKLNAAASIIDPKSRQSLQVGQILDLENEDADFTKEFKEPLNDQAKISSDNAEALEIANDESDNYVNMEIGLRRGGEGELQRAMVKKRAIDVDGKPLGKYNPNPLLDSRQYEVEYPDGGVETLTANLLAENILAQVDEDGSKHLLIDEIIDHKREPYAISKENATRRLTSGAVRKKRTTKGWKMYVQWKDGSANWISLKEAKESYPVEVAEYAKNNGLIEEPAFDWWATHVLKKKKIILSKVKSKYWERTHKYGIRVPKNIEEAKKIDLENGDTLWMDAIRKEMADNRHAFDEHEGDPKELVGFTEITGHLVFDVKLGENFRRKARFCADGHKTGAPAAITYSTVVARDSVRILLLIAALNDLPLKGADVKNAFLSAPNLEKVWIRAGPEFAVEDQGKVFIVKRALYGLKSASAAFRNYLAEKLDQMKFKSSAADPDVWMRPSVKQDGTKYYSYVLAYVDDILAISEDPDGIMNELRERFTFKNDKVEEPSNYLGARLQKRKIDGKDVWTMTSVDYINAAVSTVQNAIKGTRWKLPGRATTPIASGFVPELDDSPELNQEDKTRFQEWIGVLRWATEIGRVNILHEVSILSQYQAAPRVGHMEQVLHIVAYLKRKPKTSLYFDPGIPNIDYASFKNNAEDFKVHYRDAVEEMPHLMPLPRGVPVCIVAFVDASHGANKVTRRSHSGHVIFVNKAPIMWFSKRQNTVEASTFSSELMAMRTCIESIVHLRFKLRMFGIPLIETSSGSTAAHVFCDNESVVKNCSRVESTLNKKHNSLAYHYNRWHVAAGVVTVSWIERNENLADAFTKRLTETTRDYLFGNWTY